MLGALSMFSSEVTGQSIRTIEMSDGFRLHVRPFADGSINLAVIGGENILTDPELLQIIEKLDKDVQIMKEQSLIDFDDGQTVSVFLEDRISELDAWFGSRVFVQTKLQQARNERVVEISSQIALMSTRFTQDKVAILILDASLEALYSSTEGKINENFLASLQSHLKGWIKVSSHSDLLLPELLFFDQICIGIKALRKVYVICGIEWSGSMGDSEITSKVRSWISTLSRRLGP
jgi:hypothetical protein